MVGAFEREYRVVFLRDGTDPVGTNEFQDTINPKFGRWWLGAISVDPTH